MKFIIKTDENIFTLGRKIGYIQLGDRGGPARDTAPARRASLGVAGGHSDASREFNFVRSLSGNRYPRFHLYAKQEEDTIFFNLHLDQKQPSYTGHTAHSGEYEGELLEKEMERIKKILSNRQ